MPKMKTSKSAIKRVVGKKSGIYYSEMSAQHRSKGKSKRAKRMAGNLMLVTKGDSKKLKRLVPYIAA